MAAKSLKDPASIPVQIRDGGVVIRMFSISKLGGPLLWRIKGFVGCIVGLVQEPWTAGICLDEANAFVGLHVRTILRFVRLANPMTQKRVEAFEGVEESGVPRP